MSQLDLQPNIARPDDLYDRIIQAHEGLSDMESMELNSRLVLILANHIGDQRTIADAIALARKAGPAPGG